jgi:hypothetical protein
MLFISRASFVHEQMVCSAIARRNRSALRVTKRSAMYCKVPDVTALQMLTCQTYNGRDTGFWC